MEFGFHEAQVVLFGDHAVFVGVHEEKKLFDVFFAEGEAVLRLGDVGFLRSSGAEDGDGGDEDGGDGDDPGFVCWTKHAWPPCR